MSRRARSAAAAAILLVALASSFAVGQGFGEQGAVGESSTGRTYQIGQTASSNPGSSAYFMHDQLMKLLLVLGFTAAGLVIVLTRRFRFRKLLLIASVAGLGFAIGGVLCPVSAVQNVILKASTGYLLLFLIPTATTLLFGRLFCGYVCPFGALQDLLYVRKLRARIPERWLRRLRFLPFALLVYLVVRVLATGFATLDGMTPFKSFFALGGTPLTLAISTLFVVTSVYIFRPFCTLFCPLGAWLSLVARISPFRLRRLETCVNCSRCDAACSAHAIRSGKVAVDQCLLCGECIRTCPVDALCVSHTHTVGKAMPREK